MTNLIKQRKFAAIGSSQVFCRKGLLDRTAGDQTHVEQQDFIKVLGYGLQVMMDNECRLTGSPQFA